MRRSALAVALALGLAAAPTRAGDGDHAPRAPANDRLAVVEGTTAILNDKLAARRAQIARRLRDYYQQVRADRPRLWLDADARARDLRRRAVARRVLRRDLSELELLERERAAAAAAAARLRVASGPVAPPVPGSLLRPLAEARVVGAFGRYRDASTGAYIVRRGVVLAAGAGEDVRAADDGTVVFVGTLRGLGTAVVVEHDGFSTVLGGLRDPVVAIGDRVERGAILAVAAGGRVHVEVRLSEASGSAPVDPEPLLAP